MPFPTTVFERIGPYREVWHLMRVVQVGIGRQRKPAVATEVKEDFVLEALDTPRLYERLVVTVLLDGIRSAGLTLASVDSIPGPRTVTSANRWVFTDPRRTGPTPASRSGTSPRSTRRGRRPPRGGASAHHLLASSPRRARPRNSARATAASAPLRARRRDPGGNEGEGRGHGGRLVPHLARGRRKLRRPLKTVESEVMRAMMKYGVTTRPVRPADRMECVRLMCAIPSGLHRDDALRPHARRGPDVSVEVLTPDALSTGLVERVHALLGAGPVSGGWKAATAVGPTDAVRV